MIRDPYEVLGVSRGASMEDIKRAYRKRAKENHPDLHPDDPRATERMQQVNEAYDMLCNPDKYRAQQQARPNPYGGANPGYGGQARQSRQANRGGWQYTYYYTKANAQGDRTYWSADDGARRNVPVINPFRAVFRVMGGLLAFRFLMALLRFGLFGFFF